MGRTPERGDVFWLSLDPRLGHEQGGRRPVVILSPAFYNRRAGLLLACPITSRIKGYPFEVPLPEGLPVGGVVLADQVRSLDWHARPVDYLCTLPHSVVEEVLARAGSLLA